MIKTNMLLRTSAAVMLLAVSGCGGSSSPAPTPTPSPTATVSPTPSPTPTPTSSQAPTYSTLADLQGSFSLTTAGLSYDVSGTPGPVFNIQNQTPASGFSIEYIDSLQQFYLRASDGSVAVILQEPFATNPSPGVLQWDASSGGVTDIVTVINATGALYNLGGIWFHADAGQTVGTTRLAVGGIQTLDRDLPTANAAVYNILLGGALFDGADSQSVDATRSSGTITMDFTSGTGTFTVNLISVNSIDLGTVTGTITMVQGTSFFNGSFTHGAIGGTGILSGAFFGPQATEVALTVGIEDGTKSYVGLGGGKED